MQSEYARQTRWAGPPDPVDETLTPPGSRYARQVVWLPCTRCDLQVHAPVSRLLTEGVVCPDCGLQLAGPKGSEDARETAARVLETEMRFRQELAREETPCCD
jgi:hypothetical protein